MNFLTRRCFQTLSKTFSFPLNNCASFSYKSIYSLDVLYPNSSLKITTPSSTEIPRDPKEKFSGYIPISGLDITYSRSSAPGGQNVNKVNTKVDLRFHVKSATWISEDIKQKLMEKYRTTINKEGYFIVRSDRTRFQQLNLADALEKLRTIIRRLADTSEEITPETAERLRRKAEKNARLRLMEKRARSQTKQQRQLEVDF